MENNNNNNNNDNNDSSFTDKRKTSPSPWANSPKNRSSSSFAIGSTRTLRRSDTAPVSNSPHTSNTLRDSKKANWSSIDFGEFGEEPEVLKAPQNNLNSASNPSLINENSSNLKVVVINEKNNQNALLRQKKNETFKCTFDYKGLRIIYHASCEATAYEIKSQILKELSKNIPKTEQQENFLFPHEYLVKVVGIDEFIDKDKQQLPLRRLDFVQICSKSYITPRFEMVHKNRYKEPDEEARKLRNLQELYLGNSISTLIGPELLSTFLQYEDDEIADFRRAAIRIKHSQQEKRIEKLRYLEKTSSITSDKRIQLLPTYLHNEPMPLIVPETILVNIYLPGAEHMNVRLSVSPLLTSDQLLEKVYNKYTRTIGDRAIGRLMEEYVIKVTGRQEYFIGQTQLVGYDYIRKSISEKTEIVLSLIDITDIEDLLKSLSSTYHSMVDDLIVLETQSNDGSGSNGSGNNNNGGGGGGGGINDNRIEAPNINENFVISIDSIQRSTPKDGEPLLDDNNYYYLLIEIYHAGHKLGEGYTSGVKARIDTQFQELIMFSDIKYCHLSLGTRILFTLFVRKYDASSSSAAWSKSVLKNDEPIAWVSHQIFDHTRKMKNGEVFLRMWMGGRANPIGPCTQNLLQLNTPILSCTFYGKVNNQIVYYPKFEAAIPNANSSISEETKAKIDAIIRADPLYQLSDADKMILWGNRHYISSIPSALPKFLLTVNWGDPMQVREAHKSLPLWTKPSPLQALELLDAKFADPTVRDYGVECMKFMPDGECYDFLLQLTQVLKHEPYHNSALAMFLLKRAWNNRNIGNSFYWFLKAELHLEDLAERYTLLLESYVRGDERILTDLLKQQEVNNQLVSVALKVKMVPKEERKKVLYDNLEKIKFPSNLQLSLNQKVEVKDLIVNKCKYMDSKKLPLWLVWNSTESYAPPTLVIFKVGDDLRQDVLTLQILRIFDKLWKNEGLDLLLQPYGCIATGDETGMIEVVKNAETTANINKAAGGTKAVLKEHTLTKWLRKHNQTPEQMAKAKENFLLSCAGYCVATFVLGIGDRHNDNIMMTRNGRLFHIDFGHFLGNFKKKYGIKRERAKFVFTPQYAHVLDGPKSELFVNFEEVCARAFNILRRKSDLFITLFQMMLCTGIPELSSEGDIEYLRDAFALGKTEEEAAVYFTKLINDSLHTKTTVINDVIHVFAHK